MKHFIFPIILMTLPAVSYGAATVTKAAGTGTVRIDTASAAQPVAVKKQNAAPVRASSIPLMRMPNVGVSGEAKPYAPGTPGTSGGGGGNCALCGEDLNLNLYATIAEFNNFRNSTNTQFTSLWAIVDVLDVGEGKQDKLSVSNGNLAKGKVAVWDTNNGRQTTGWKGVVSTTSGIAIGSQDLVEAGAVASYIANNVNVSGKEDKSNKIQNVGSVSAGDRADRYPSVAAVQTYVQNAIDEAIGSGGGSGGGDVSNKQNKATGVQGGNVATWACTGTGAEKRCQTEGEKTIVNNASGIDETSQGLVEGRAVYNYVMNSSPAANKQEKATGMTAGNVALWASDGSGKFQTAGQKGIVSSILGLTTATQQDLITAGAVSDAIAAATFTGGGIGSVTLAADTNPATVRLTVDGAAQTVTVPGVEITNNKITAISSASTHTQYPSARAVWDVVSGIVVPDIGSKEDVANKSTNIVTDSGSNIKYPTVAAVQAAIAAASLGGGTGGGIGSVTLAADTNPATVKLTVDGAAQTVTVPGVEITNNKVTTVSSTSTDTQYPSAKAVYAYGDTISANLKNYVDVTIDGAGGGGGDNANKQDKASNMTQGYVATWGAQVNGKNSTAGQVAIINANDGIVESATGLTTGHAVYKYGENLINEVVPGVVDALAGNKQDKLPSAEQAGANGKVALWGAAGSTTGTKEVVAAWPASGAATNAGLPTVAAVAAGTVTLTGNSTITGEKNFQGGTVLVATPTLPTP